MKGLFLDNYYKTISGMKLFLCLIGIIGIIVLVTANSSMLEIFVYLGITAFSVSSVSSMRKDMESKWNRFELTLPIKRNDIIKSKYISYTFWLLLGIVVTAIITGLAVLIHGNVFFVFGLQDIASLFILGITIALLVGSIFYPAVYFLGSDKSETLLLISNFLGIALSIGFIWITRRPLFLQMNYYVRLMIFLAMAIVVFIGSYFLTVKIFSKKEY